MDSADSKTPATCHQCLSSAMRNISKLRKALKSRDIENRMEDPHMSLRDEILGLLKCVPETKRKVYIPLIKDGKIILEDKCKELLERARLIEKAYLMVIKHQEAIFEDIVATVHTGVRDDEDFYMKIKDDSSDYILYSLRDAHSVYRANIPNDESDDEISFCHA
jgi:hypothetical protein